MYYYLKLDGPEERWVSWGRWYTDDPEDEGFYVVSTKYRACLISEEYLLDELVQRQIGRFGSYKKIPADEKAVRKYRCRIFTRL